MTTRLPCGAAVALSAALWASLGVLSSNASPWPGGALPPPPAQEESACRPVHRQAASAETVLLGETLAVTIAVRPGCPDDAMPLHVLLAVDGSASMRTPNALVKSALVRFVQSLGLDSHPTTRVGIVQFGDRARTLCRLTNDPTIAVACANRIGASGGTAMDEGILEATEVLRGGRPAAGAGPVAEVIVLLADGTNTRGCPPVLQAAEQARAMGIVLMAVCIAPLCDEACLRQVASSPANYERAESASSLYGVMDRVRARLETAVVQLEVDDVLHPSMAYVAGSASPPPGDPAAPSYHLSWQETLPGTSAFTATFGVRPMQAGTWPICFATTGRIVDWRGLTREWAFESPLVRVLDPHPTPTPSPIVPEATASASATSPASPTAAPALPTVYLPSLGASRTAGVVPER